MTLLIYSFGDDAHAGAVAWAFREHCGTCDILDYGDFPNRWQVSASVSSEADLAIRSASAAGRIDHEAYSVVWNRRTAPVGEAPGIAEQDVEIARTTSKRFLDQVRTLEWPGQLWVNPREKQLRADNKMYQLRLARRCGLCIPDTLFSNDPAEVRAFVASRGPAIVKSMFPINWYSQTDPRSLPTTDISLEQLAADLPVLACPLIYQGKTRKAFELRVVVLGREIVACRLNSQAMDESRVDFRMVNPHHLDVEPFALPAGLSRQILDFMQSAGLVHGALDFAVDTEGNFIFYEINEQGQTLWLEECNPEVRILDRLISFFESASPSFLWDGRNRASFHDWPDPAEGPAPVPA
jgi:hypothetical protein